jgi:hypothetical protein
MSSRHDLWRFVSINLEAMNREAPEGFLAVASVYVHGRVNPIVINGRVETTRDPAWPWVLFVTEDPGDNAEETHRQPTAIFVREDLIMRVEVAYRPISKRSLGFTYNLDLNLGENSRPEAP